MRVFDLLPYGEHLDHLKEGNELPWPLPRRHFKPEVAVCTYEEHLEAWQTLDELGYDGVGFNEHHTSPYGLMNSPNIMAASAAQRTRRLKLQPGNIACPGVSTFFGSNFVFAAWTVCQAGP